ncbi:MAG TPA: type II secretion system ATPase GspE [Acidobacteriota bacterium]|nr:type II secretion system ATPase GspE [Acidobacteriota bacterium]
MTTADDFVLQLALERGLVAADAVEAARRVAAELADLTSAPPSVLESLHASGALDRRALAEALAQHLGMPFVAIGDRQIPGDVLGALPRSFVMRYGVCAVALTNSTVQVAVADPLDADVLDGLAHVCGLPVTPVVATSDDLQRTIARHYGREADEMEDLTGEAGESGAAEIAVSAVDPTTRDSDAPIIRLVHSIVHEAVRRRASDIHLEPLERRFRVRYRIDGVLVEVDSPAKRLQLALISRVKIMANISIAEKRVPQDGRIQIMLAGKQLDLRVSSLPTAHGESIVMRILDKEGLRLGLPELGFYGDDETHFSKLISSPDGILLVTGPTGSGKTTTLYACLHHLNKSDRKIITVEDPVEYQLTGINQVPVRAEIGMTFASALRAMLRQAPNIVMVGEIRDAETADIAINASLTGHLVFSTLHTNDAPSAVTRLIDIGAKPFLVAASLRATMAQRLVRRVCGHCARDYTPTARELIALGAKPEQLKGARFMRGAGCAECHGTGYRGRMGIFEIFLISDDIRAMIYENASATQLRARARRDGMRTMREDGVRKVLAGLTTIEEVVSVTVGDLD